MYVFKVLALLFCAVPLLAASKFPTYLQKCKNDEHLNACFLKSARAGIVNILKGDPQLGIPQYKPLKVPYQIVLETKDLKLVIDNLKVVAPVVINDAKWDTDKRNISMKVDFTKIIWDYTGKLDGKFLDQNVNASGNFTHIYENGWGTHNLLYDIVEIDGEKYGSINGGTSSYTSGKITCMFENINDDMQQLINKNWEKFDGLFHKDIEVLITRLISGPFKAIFKVTPIDQLFE
ncbi:uncharacterized protein CBL_04891 [Carabus blaptoides fortunei]